MEQGHTVVTAALVAEAAAALRPQPANMEHMNEAARAVAIEALRKEPATVYLCPQCGHAARGTRPVACSTCGVAGEGFLAVDPEVLEATASVQGGVEEAQAFDGRAIRWAKAALDVLQRTEGSYERNQLRLRVEKAARLARMPVITVEFAVRHLPEAGRAGGADA